MLAKFQYPKCRTMRQDGGEWIDAGYPPVSVGKSSVAFQRTTGPLPEALAMRQLVAAVTLTRHNSLWGVLLFLASLLMQPKPFSFRLETIFHVFALVAAALVTFGPGGVWRRRSCWVSGHRLPRP